MSRRGRRLYRWASLSDILTLANWPVVLFIGLTGFVVAYQRPMVKDPEKVDTPPVEILEVELVADSVSLVQDTFPPDTMSDMPPPIAPESAPPAAPELISVADPSQVAFALPVEGDVRLVDASEASYYAPGDGTDQAMTSAIPTTRLTFGRGEGQQPAPRYPPKAVRQGQEGRVGITFVVGENGRVASAEATSPCSWRLLNREALRVVEERWRFSRGAIRRFEVFIDFQLSR